MFGSNVDDVRARIMALECSPVYDAAGWQAVLAALHDRPAAFADAQRRMCTARGNQVVAQCAGSATVVEALHVPAMAVPV